MLVSEGLLGAGPVGAGGAGGAGAVGLPGVGSVGAGGCGNGGNVAPGGGCPIPPGPEGCFDSSGQMVV